MNDLKMTCGNCLRGMTTWNKQSGKTMWQRGMSGMVGKRQWGKTEMREYDYDNTRDDEKARGYLPPGLRGAVGKGSPRPDEDNRLLSCLLMKPGIRITQDCADPCRGMSTQEPVGSKKCVEAWPRPAIRVVVATSSGSFFSPTW